MCDNIDRIDWWVKMAILPVQNLNVVTSLLWEINVDWWVRSLFSIHHAYIKSLLFNSKCGQLPVIHSVMELSD